MCGKAAEGSGSTATEGFVAKFDAFGTFVWGWRSNVAGADVINACLELPTGEVIAVGNGQIQEDGSVRALEVQAGDLVLFGKWSGTEIKIDGEELLIMKESDILGILDAEVATKQAA